MKTTDKASNAATEETLASIDIVALDDVTGGCGACGQTCANGPAPTAAGAVNKAGLLAAAFSAFSRR